MVGDSGGGAGDSAERDMVGCDVERHAKFCGALHKDFTHLRDVAFAQDYRYAGLDDACFLGCNGSEGVAKLRRVVEGNIGYDRQNGGDDVGGVKSSAKSYFDNCDVNAGFGKPIEGHDCGKLEEGWGDAKVGSKVFFKPCYNFGLGDLLAVDTDALTEVDQMGGSK